MRTHLDCVPCFFKQALAAARLAGAGPKLQKRIIDRLARMLPAFPLSSSPPEMGRDIYRMVGGSTGKKDLFKGIRRHSNRLALGSYPALKRKVTASPDGLLTATRLAIAGNIIDYGAKNSLDVEAELRKILARGDVRRAAGPSFHYGEFRRALQGARVILYLADNAGEVVFDRILIEEIRRRCRPTKIIYAVKDKPAINDALLKDALECGIGTVADVVSCGSDAPGTVLRLCTPDFLRLYRDADVVISKGQGNFEVLSDETRPIFFLFMAKCPVVARDVGCSIGELILLRSPQPGRTYVLLLALSRRQDLHIGGLNRVSFPSGTYLYIGSAKSNMEARIRRHLGDKKRKYWHIDYLLSSPHSRIQEVWTSPLGQECPTAGALRAAGYGATRGFGSSDCACRSHLFHIPPAQRLRLKRLLGSRGFKLSNSPK